MIEKDELSIDDLDYAKIITDILAAKYGVIACEEPILHTAIANTAALNFITSELRKYFSKQQYKISEQYNNININVENTLMYFEKNISSIIKKNTSEVHGELISQYSKITRKQIAQVQNIIDNDLANAIDKCIADRVNSAKGNKDINLYLNVGTFVVSILCLITLILS
ncbi:TPA: hypothetical protein ACX6RT_003743 [Photobacterium damselae]